MGRTIMLSESLTSFSHSPPGLCSGAALRYTTLCPGVFSHKRKPNCAKGGPGAHVSVVVDDQDEVVGGLKAVKTDVHFPERTPTFVLFDRRGREVWRGGLGSGLSTP